MFVLTLELEQRAMTKTSSNHTPKTLRAMARGAFMLPPPADGDSFLTVELAEALHVNTRTVRRWCEAGKLKAVRRFGYITIPAREAQRFINKGRSGAP